VRTIIAGSRSVTDYAVVEEAVRASGFEVTSTLCGCARGVDKRGAEWAAENHLPTVHYPADWKKHGKSAGIIRNEEMAANADALVAVWDGKSPGTAHMIGAAKRRGLKVYVHDVSEHGDGAR
jgi:hypothetical protein